MNKIEMYRYSVTGSLGYYCYLDGSELLRISAAVLPNTPIDITGSEFKLHSEKFFWAPPEEVFVLGKGYVKNDSAEEWHPTNERLVTNELGETIAVLIHKRKYFLLKYQNDEVIITSENKQYIFSTNGRKVAFMQRPSNPNVPKHLTEPYWTYDWLHAFELFIDPLPDVLIGLIAAFPLLKFDYQEET